MEKEKEQQGMPARGLLADSAIVGADVHAKANEESGDGWVAKYPAYSRGEAQPEDLVRVIMPSEGDMELVDQNGGVLLLRPTYFGGECSGPIVQFVTRTGSRVEVNSAYRLKIRTSGGKSEIRLAKADQGE